MSARPVTAAEVRVGDVVVHRYNGNHYQVTHVEPIAGEDGELLLVFRGAMVSRVGADEPVRIVDPAEAAEREVRDRVAEAFRALADLVDQGRLPLPDRWEVDAVKLPTRGSVSAAAEALAGSDLSVSESHGNWLTEVRSVLAAHPAAPDRPLVELCMWHVGKPAPDGGEAP